MTIEYNLTDPNKGEAIIHYNSMKCRLAFSKMVIYDSVEDNQNDPFVPYSYKAIIDNALCFHDDNVLQNFSMEVEEAGNTLLSIYPFRSIFVAMDLLSVYQSIFQMFERCVEQYGDVSVFNNEESIELTKHWPRFPERFHNHPLWKNISLLVKNEHLPVYQGNWIDQTKKLR